MMIAFWKPLVVSHVTIYVVDADEKDRESAIQRTVNSNDGGYSIHVTPTLQTVCTIILHSDPHPMQRQKSNALDPVS